MTASGKIARDEPASKALSVAQPDRMAVSLNVDLARRLSSPLHSRQPFIGQTMATVAFRPGSASDELQVVFADERSKAAIRLAQSYEAVVAILRSSSCDWKINRFLISSEDGKKSACGVCVQVDRAPVAVILWPSLEKGPPPLGALEEAIAKEVRALRASKVNLSERELEILALSAEGMTSQEIARNCEITEATVNEHISKAMKKTRTRNRAHMVSFAIRSGYI